MAAKIWFLNKSPFFSGRHIYAQNARGNLHSSMVKKSPDLVRKTGVKLQNRILQHGVEDHRSWYKRVQANGQFAV
jgi:hypothetical protein